MNRKKFLSVLLIAVMTLTSVIDSHIFIHTVSADVNDYNTAELGDFSHYNGIFFGDFEAYSADSEGAVAIGGLAKFGTGWGQYDVGAALAPNYSYVAIGKYNNPNNYPTLLLTQNPKPPSMTYTAMHAYGGPIAIPKTVTYNNLISGTVRYVEDNHVDNFFEGAYETFTNIVDILDNANTYDKSIDLTNFSTWNSSQLYHNQYNNNSSSYFNTVTLEDKTIAILNIKTGKSASIFYSSLTKDDLGTYDLIVFNFLDAENVSMTGASLNNINPNIPWGNPALPPGDDYNLFTEYCQKVVWNFPQAKKINIQAHSVIGSVLAPSADIEADGGSINGMTVANNISTKNGFELHAFKPNIDIPLFNQKKPDPDYYEVNFTKIDSKTKEKLTGAEFKLINTDTDTVYEAKPDPNGFDWLIHFEDLIEGNYELIETKAPDGYKFSTEPIPFKIPDDLNDNNFIKDNYYIENDPLTVDVSFKKVDASDTSIGLVNARFSLYKVNYDRFPISNSNTTYNLNKIDSDIPSGSDGTFNINGLTEGHYVLVESAPPEGYTMGNEQIHILVVLERNSGSKELNTYYYAGDYLEDITKTNPSSWDTIKNLSDVIQINNDSIIITNSKEESSVTYYPTVKIVKVDENGVLLKGAEFQLESPNGIATKTYTTNENGVIEIDFEIDFADIISNDSTDLLGDYRLTESKAPSGYDWDQDVALEFKVYNDNDGNFAITEILTDSLFSPASIVLDNITPDLASPGEDLEEEEPAEDKDIEENIDDNEESIDDTETDEEENSTDEEEDNPTEEPNETEDNDQSEENSNNDAKENDNEEDVDTDIMNVAKSFASSFGVGTSFESFDNIENNSSANEDNDTPVEEAEEPENNDGSDSENDNTDDTEEPVSDKENENSSALTDEISEINTASAPIIQQTNGALINNFYLQYEVINKQLIKEIQIVKMDDQATPQPVTGAIFEITKEKNNIKETIGTYISNSDGLLVPYIDQNNTNGIKVTDGTYTVKELYVPSGYVSLTEPIVFEVSYASNDITINLNSYTQGENSNNQANYENDKITITNSIILKSILILKVGIDPNLPSVEPISFGPALLELPAYAEPLGDVRFDLYKYDNDNNVYTQIRSNLQTSANDPNKGVIEIENLAYGNYYLEETSTVEGYVSAADYIYFTIMDDLTFASSDPIDTIYLYVPNYKEPQNFSVAFTKVDGSRKDYTLSNAKFDLYSYISSDENDYDNADNWNQIRPNLTTGENGRLEISGLSEGTYKFVEVQPPIGYKYEERSAIFKIDSNGKHEILTEHLKGVEVITNGSSTIVTVLNDKDEQFPNMKLYKRDSADEKGLEGAKFNLLYSATQSNPKDIDKYNLYAELVSDYNGKIDFPELITGYYILEETEPPVGYDKRDTIFNFRVFEHNNELIAEYKGVYYDKDAKKELPIYNDKTTTPPINPPPIDPPTEPDDKDENPDPTPPPVKPPITPPITPPVTPPPITPPVTPPDTDGSEEPDPEEPEYPDEPGVTPPGPNPEEPDRERPPITVVDEDTDEEYTLVYIPEEDIYEVYDRNHNLIGHMKLPEGVALEGLIMWDYFIPLNKVNPKTMDSLIKISTPTMIAVVVCSYILVVVYKKNKIKEIL